MARLVFFPGKQREFLGQVEVKLLTDVNGVAKILGIASRSYREWKYERTLGTEDGLKKLSCLSGVDLPEIIEKREEFWSAKKFATMGALARLKKYGPPGTPGGRVKGGTTSQLRRRENPDYYRELGCNVANSFKFPKQSAELAEFVGIVLGDGGITQVQVGITLNSIADRQYVRYIMGLIKNLFGYTCRPVKRKDCNAIVVLISGVDMIRWLQSIGLKVGNKVKQQVGVPVWIRDNLEWSKWCVRGLMDTDGCLYKNDYWINGRRYKYVKACFSNKSQPLRHFVFDTLCRLGFSPKLTGDHHVGLYSEKETRRYLQIVGSSNWRLVRMVR